MSTTAPKVRGGAALPDIDIDIEFDETWKEDALCAQTDPEAFFPEKGDNVDAKRVCSGCDVQMQCLIKALRNDEPFGIWGGFSTQERRRIRSRLPPSR